MKELKDEGFTLIEVVIAIAIAAILIGGITAFMNAGTTNFQAVQDEVDIQTETQLLMGQIGDLILEGNHADYDEEKRTLTIYHIDEESNTISRKEIIWFDGAGHLYLFSLLGTDIPDLSMDSRYLFGEHVKSFSAQVSEEEVKVSVTLEKGKKDYSTENLVKMRNRYVELP